MALIAYIRVSTVGQSLEVQKDQITAYGVSKIFSDKATGTNTNRDGLTSCLDYLRDGDKLVITKMDRLGRSALDLLKIAADLEARGVSLVILDQGMDTSTSAGKLFFNMLAAVSEFEVNIRKERQILGIAKAKVKGKYKGRKPTALVLKPKMIELLKTGMTRVAIAKQLGVSKQSVYKMLTGI